MNITVQLPLKAIIMYAYYLSVNSQWEDRKTPDEIKTLIGNNTNPNTIFTITVKTTKLIFLIRQLLSERNGVIRDVYKSIVDNQPTINGYTSLASQLVSKAANNTDPEKEAAQEIIDNYLEYVATLDSLYNENFQKGLDWINN